MSIGPQHGVYASKVTAAGPAEIGKNIRIDAEMDRVFLNRHYQFGVCPIVQSERIRILVDGPRDIAVRQSAHAGQIAAIKLQVLAQSYADSLFRSGSPCVICKPRSSTSGRTAHNT